MKRIKTLLAMTMVAALTGCATSPVPVVQPKPTDDPAFMRLLEATEEIRRINVQSAMIESARSNKAGLVRAYEFDYQDLPEKWGRSITLLEDFNGDILTFIKLLTSMCGLEKPLTVGDIPSNPVLISISKGERQLMDFIADAGYQSGDGVLIKPVIKQDKILVVFEG